MAKSAESAQLDWIKVCLRKGESRKVILAKFVKKWQDTSTRTFDRRLKQAELSMASELEAIKDKANKNIELKAKELSTQILSTLERQIILSQIARGEIPLSKPMVVDKSIVDIDFVPDWMDRKNAIAELNKMDGSYVPVKIAQTDKEGNDITPTITNYVIPAIGEIELKE